MGNFRHQREARTEHFVVPMSYQCYLNKVKLRHQMLWDSRFFTITC